MEGGGGGERSHKATTLKKGNTLLERRSRGGRSGVSLFGAHGWLHLLLLLLLLLVHWHRLRRTLLHRHPGHNLARNLDQVLVKGERVSRGVCV